MEQKNTTREKLWEEYSELVSNFVEKVKNLSIEGIPAPHIPVVGGNYDMCAYKMAFIGMETRDTPKKLNCKNFIDNRENTMQQFECWLDRSGMFPKKGRAKSAYWNFVKNFLKKFYSIKEKELKIAKGEYHAIMSSFVWGNANAIERYEVTAKRKNVDRTVWKKIKDASIPFDNINHLIDATQPKVIFITYKVVSQEYITTDNEVCSEKQIFSVPKGKEIAIRHYYLRNRDTHVFVTPHPTWMIRSKIGFKPYINALTKSIKEHNIWSQLPQSKEDWKIKEK